MNKTPDTFLLVTQLGELAVLLAVVVVLLRRWVAHRAAATGWALAMFGTLAAVVAVAQLHIRDSGSTLTHGYTVVLVCVLLLVPYLLVRFALALGALGSRRHRGAVVVTAVLLVATALAPRFPQ